MTTSPFIDETTDKVTIPEDLGGGWVELKREMSLEDWEKVQGEQLRVIQKTVGGNRATRRQAARTAAVIEEAPAEGYWSPGEITLLERNIVAWSYDRELNRANITKLKVPFKDFLVLRIQELNLPLLGDSEGITKPTTKPSKDGDQQQTS